jgi:hypothetical protein
MINKLSKNKNNTKNLHYCDFSLEDPVGLIFRKIVTKGYYIINATVMI